MKAGDTIQVRRVGTDQWVPVLVDLASKDQVSLAVSAAERLFGSGEGLAINIDTGRMQLLLLKHGEVYIDLFTNGAWEVREGGE